MKYLKNIELLPHQIASTKHAESFLREKKPVRILFIHQVGTGKTITALSVLSKIREYEPEAKFLYIVPASLINHTLSHFDTFTNLKAEHLNDLDKLSESYDVYVASYDFIRNNIKDILKHPNFKNIRGVIIDEIHNLRNENTKIYEASLELSKNVKHFIGLTATPVSNKYKDFTNILILTLPQYEKHKEILEKNFRNYIRDSKSFFKEHSALYKFLRGEEIKTKEPVFDWFSIATIKHLLSNYVNYYFPDETELKRPKASYENIEVPFTKEQEEKFREYVRKMENRVYEMLLQNKKDKEIAKNILLYFQKLRLISNNIRHVDPNISEEEIAFKTPKLFAVLKKVKEILDEDPEHQVVIYSNFKDNVIKPLSVALTKLGLEHEIFTGEQTQSQRKKAIENIINKKSRIILLSPAGAEGLSLYTASHLIIVDPHPNPVKEKQVEGRILRTNSIPQNVKIIRFFAVPTSKDLRDKKWMVGIDKYISSISKEKEITSQVLHNILKSYSERKFASLIDYISIKFYIHSIFESYL
ncbi:MAG: SNF2-related protein [Minisyncoccia bacterium]|jgi:superfamily II DNA or RNA helicase